MKRKRPVSPDFLYFIAAIVIFIISCVFAWLISISELPNWFKFWLLK